MSDQLAAHEKTAFAILHTVLKDGRVERDSLRVLVASRGGDLGRDYIRLRDLGFVEEVDRRAGFLRRLFGAKPVRMVGLTAKGLALAAEAGLVDVPEAASGVVAPVAVAGAAPLPEVVEPVAEVGGAPVPEMAAPLAEAGVAPVAGDAAEAVTGSGAVGAADALEVADEAIGDAAAPVVEAAEGVEAAAVGAAPMEAAVAPAAAAARPRPAPRFTPADFTEAVGGAPVDDGLALPEGDRLDGLAELLALQGFELMPAGRLLAAHRWAEGFADADVALEVLVVSVAHAARLDRTGTARLDREAMLAVVDAVGGTLAQLVAEGALVADQVEESLATMRVFVRGEDGAEAALAALLDDPLRGLAPPAICPEGVWVPADDGE